MGFWSWVLQVFRRKQPALALPTAPETPELPGGTTETKTVQVEPANGGEIVTAEKAGPIEAGVKVEETIPIELPAASDAPAAADEPSRTEEPVTLEEPASPTETQLTATRPTYTKEWLRKRTLYFTPPPHATSALAPERILAPDLQFRLGPFSRISIGAPAATQKPTAIGAASPLLQEFVTARPGTTARQDSAGRVLSVDPLAFTLFLTTRENGESEYLTEPALLAHALALRDLAIENWRAGKPPFTAQALYDAAFQRTHHAGTALLTCHNVAKAFARGSDALQWRVVDRTRGVYCDGKLFHTAAVRARSPLAMPSIFYQLFSAAEFGAADPGDWYRYFASSLTAHYGAMGQARAVIAPVVASVEKWAKRLSDVAADFKDSRREWNPAYQAWLWTNSWTALEFATYGRGPAMHERAIVTMRGAVFGLAEAGASIDAEWREWTGHEGPDMRLSPSTIAAIAASPRPYVSDGSFTLAATVEEGLSCRFTIADWSDERLAPLAPRIVDEIGFKAIEYAARRQVIIRCTGALHCGACDRGDGFVDIAVKES